MATQPHTTPTPARRPCQADADADAAPPSGRRRRRRGAPVRPARRPCDVGPVRPHSRPGRKKTPDQPAGRLRRGDVLSPFTATEGRAGLHPPPPPRAGPHAQPENWRGGGGGLPGVHVGASGGVCHLTSRASPRATGTATGLVRGCCSSIGTPPAGRMRPGGSGREVGNCGRPAAPGSLRAPGGRDLPPACRGRPLRRACRRLTLPPKRRRSPFPRRRRRRRRRWRWRRR